jgi:hypothetical protein
MSYVTCPVCGSWFDRGPEETWKTLCLSCWKRRKTSSKAVESNQSIEIENLKFDIEWLEEEIDQLNDELKSYHLRDREFKEFLPFLIFSAHPDRHVVDKAAPANRATAWLLKIREGLK